MKKILITGTSSGFGKLTVQTLAKDGHHVFASMRGIKGKNAEAAASLTKWANENNVKVDVVELDVTSDESVENAKQEILAKADSIDVVVNNAGIYGSGFSESYTIDDYKAMFEVNVFGSLRVIHAFLPSMRKQKSGLLVQVSSIMGRFVIPFNSTYTSSKWAIEGITETLRYDLAPLGIDSVIVEPGAFQTDIFGKMYQAKNQEVTSEYGPAAEAFKGFSENFGAMMAGEVPNQPQDVADAIKKLVDTPTGERPLRVVVDKMMSGTADAVNEVGEKVQEGFLENLGLSSLLQTKTEAKV